MQVGSSRGYTAYVFKVANSANVYHVAVLDPYGLLVGQADVHPGRRPLRFGNLAIAAGGLRTIAARLGDYHAGVQGLIAVVDSKIVTRRCEQEGRHV